MKTAFAVPLAAAVLSTLVNAQTPSPIPAPVVPVAVIVKVPKPWYAPRAVVVGKMRDTIPQYQNLPGLNYKMFSFAQVDGHFGGVYLWKDRAAAEAWFNPAWFERVRRERGVEGQVRMFEAPVVLVNPGANAGSGEGDAVATLVTIPTPPGVTRERLIAEYQAALPVYERVAGLQRKYFIITGDGRFGGIYQWANQAAADAWFNQGWHERVRKTYGAVAAIEWFDTPLLLPSKLADNRIDTARP